MRYELSDHEWSVIRVMLPTKSRGKPRVDDRRVLNGIFWVLRSGAPWRDFLTSMVLAHLLQSLRALAESRCLGEHHGGVNGRAQCSRADDGYVNGARAPACLVYYPQRQSGGWTFARWSDQQAACGGRRQGPAPATGHHGRPNSRQSPLFSFAPGQPVFAINEVVVSRQRLQTTRICVRVDDHTYPRSSATG